MSNPQNPHYREFKNKIRFYNTKLSFASFGAKIVQLPGCGPYSFKIQGSVYHRTSHMTANEDENPQFAQLFFMDSESANDYRVGENDSDFDHYVSEKFIFFKLQNFRD